MQAEWQVGEALCSRAGLHEGVIDTLVVTASLPRAHQALMGAALVQRLGLAVGRVIEFNGGCGSILEALHYAFGCWHTSERLVIMALDSFASSYAASSAGRQWVDGGGLIKVESAGGIRLSLLAYVTAFDSSYIDVAHPLGGEVAKPFAPKAVNGFDIADRDNIEAVVLAAVHKANAALSDIDAVVTINRSTTSLSWVPKWIGSHCYFAHSRDEISHAGGADILANLRDALGRVRGGCVCVLGTGVGYAWQAMLLRIG
jgi:3-oxoacyl-[acyl-carrier-protein] synthase III